MTGTLHIVGLGPGDPELVTLKAARTLASARLVAFFAKRGRPGHARRIAALHLPQGAEELRLEYPLTTEIPVSHPGYAAALTPFYETCAARLAARLEQGEDVALLCEGDPFLYGSAMSMFDRLAGRFPTEIVPGVAGMSGCWTRARLPMTHGDDVLAVLPGTLAEDRLADCLRASDAAVIMKIGRNLPKVRAALARAGCAERAVYVERGTMAGERVVPVAALGSEPAPYFSTILVPGRQRAR